MTYAVRDAAATLRPIQAWQVRDPGNVSRTIQIGQVRDPGNVLRVFYSPMKVSITPPALASTVSGYLTFPVTITSLIAEAFPAGGIAPITYAWARISGSTGISATAPAAKQTRFTATFASEDGYNAIFEVTATDAAGAKAKAQVEVTLDAVDYH